MPAYRGTRFPRGTTVADKPLSSIPLSGANEPQEIPALPRQNWFAALRPFLDKSPAPGEPGYSQDIRRDIADAIEQGARPAEKTTVSSHDPHTDYNSIADRIYIEGWVLALTFGAVEEWRAGRMATAFLCAVMSAFCQFVVIRWSAWIKTHPNNPALRSLNVIATDARWWVATLMVFIAYLAFSPFVEQQRWPFTVTLPGTPSASDVAKAIAPVLSERDTALVNLASVTKERDDLRHQLEIARPPQMPTGLLNELYSDTIRQDQLRRFMVPDLDRQIGVIANTSKTYLGLLVTKDMQTEPNWRIDTSLGNWYSQFTMARDQVEQLANRYFPNSGIHFRLTRDEFGPVEGEEACGTNVSCTQDYRNAFREVKAAKDGAAALRKVVDKELSRIDDSLNGHPIPGNKSP